MHTLQYAQQARVALSLHLKYSMQAKRREANFSYRHRAALSLIGLGPERAESERRREKN